MVTVLLFAAAAEAAGCRQATVQAATVREAIAAVAVTASDRFPRILDWCSILVNEERSDQADPRVLRPGDEVAILPPVSGGCR